MYYPAQFQSENTGYTVSFRDIPEANTQGDSLDEAKSMAVLALIDAFDFYIEKKIPIPHPTPPTDGDTVIDLPVAVWLKVLLHNEFITHHMTKCKFAKKLEIEPQHITRLFNFHHKTQIDTLQKAFKVLGKSIVITLT